MRPQIPPHPPAWISVSRPRHHAFTISGKPSQITDKLKIKGRWNEIKGKLKQAHGDTERVPYRWFDAEPLKSEPADFNLSGAVFYDPTASPPKCGDTLRLSSGLLIYRLQIHTLDKPVFLGWRISDQTSGGLATRRGRSPDPREQTFLVREQARSFPPTGRRVFR
jgi:hypothetical protein